MPSRATTVLLVRHGHTDSTGVVLPGRAPGLHLSERGRTQASAVGERLRALPRRPVAIYTSPLERTRETAAAIGTALGKRPLVSKALVECDFGTWTGRKIAGLVRRPEWRTVQIAPSRFRFPDGESFPEMQQRIWTALEKIASEHPRGIVVVVSHADPIKAAVTYAMGVPLDLFQRTVISPCSVSAIVLSAGPPIALCVNATGTLSELVPS